MSYANIYNLEVYLRTECLSQFEVLPPMNMTDDQRN